VAATEDGHIPLFAFSAPSFSPQIAVPLKFQYTSSMRNAVWLALLLGVPAFCQTTPDNAAADALSKRIQSLKLLKGNPVSPTPTNVVAVTGAAPRTCSIPLLNAMRPDFSSKMPVVNPAISPEIASREAKLQVPAPPCDPTLFQNK
jgi:hypothetical protein